MSGHAKLFLLVMCAGTLLAAWNAAACTISITIQANAIAESSAVEDYVTVYLSSSDCPGGAQVVIEHSGDGAIALHNYQGGDPPALAPNQSYALLAQGTAASTSLPGATVTAKVMLDGQQLATASATKPVIKVKGPLQWQDGTNWIDITDRLYVMKDTTVTFKATPSAGTTWPANKPVWKLGDAVQGDASETKSITFATKGQTTVSASTGDNPVTVNVTVYELTPELEAEDDFTGRSTSCFGVAERVYLYFTTDPPVTAAQMGGLWWSRNTAGSGSVSNDAPDGSGTGLYTAPCTPFEVTLSLSVLSGPSKNKEVSTSFSIIAPTGTRMERVNANTWHEEGVASAGMRLYYYLEPKNVSFHYVTFRENVAPATNVTGMFLRVAPDPWGTDRNQYPNGGAIGDHQAWNAGLINGGDSTTGCRVNNWDTCATRNKPFDAGTYTWAIPTQYIYVVYAYTFGTPQTFSVTIEANGTATVTKGGQTATKTLGAPGSGY